MGWDFTYGASKQDIIMSVTRNYDETESGYVRETVATRVVGNHLWVVFRIGNSKTGVTPSNHIVLFLLAKSGGNWGYKDIAAESHPYYYDCPIGLLALAPVENQEWRNGVIAHHAAKSAQHVAMRVLTPGAVITLKEGWSPSGAFEVTSVKPLRAISSVNRRVYRIQPRSIATACPPARAMAPSATPVALEGGF